MRDTVIDGYSQPGAKPNTLSVGDNAVILIQIDGSDSKVPLTGLGLSGITSPRGQYFPAHYTIKGLSLTGFTAQAPLPAGYCGPDKVQHSYAIQVGTVYSAFIVGNFIGVLPDGETLAANDRGIRLPDHPDSALTVDYTVVGGSDPASRNVISGHSDYGVSGGGIVQGNYVGTNAILHNRQIGIDLGGDGATPNDTNDADSGPNNFQNYPLISSVKILNSPRGFSTAFVDGTLNSAPNSSFQLEFFISSAAGLSEGEIFVRSANVTTDATGNVSFHTGFDTDPGRPFYSATATDSSGNTSEFSPAFSAKAQLLNISTRATVGTGDNVLIAGFIVVGTDEKKVILRGLGPSLAQAGASGALADPTLELHDSTGALL